MMMMRYKKTGIFCCDIYNTYLFRDENHVEELKEFINNLNKIITYDKLDILYFSFITTADKQIVEEVIDDIKYHLSTNIVLIENFFYNGYILNEEIKSYEYNLKGEAIDYLDKKYKPFKIYFADDGLFNHKMVNIDVIHFLLGNNYENYYCSSKKGLNGLNIAIEKYLC